MSITRSARLEPYITHCAGGIKIGALLKPHLLLHARSYPATAVNVWPPHTMDGAAAGYHSAQQTGCAGMSRRQISADVQIDAAINPGNSGGPAFASLAQSEVVGVAFSRHKNAEATGYIIPYVVVEHFLESFRRRGLFQGLCCLGVLVNRLENPSLRRFHKVQTPLLRAAAGMPRGCCLLGGVLRQIRGPCQSGCCGRRLSWRYCWCGMVT